MKTNQNNTKGKNIVTQFSSGVNGWQRKAASLLNEKTKDWTPARLKIGLMIFCLLMSCASLYIAGTALRNDHGPPLIRSNEIKIPAIKRQPGKLNNQDSIIIKSNSK